MAQNNSPRDRRPSRSVRWADLNAITKSIGQFQRGVSDFLSAVENFNKTMEQLHGVAERVNGLLDTVEEPIRAFVPQVTKVVNAADAMVEQLSGPIDRVAPGLVTARRRAVVATAHGAADRPRRVHDRVVRPRPQTATARPDGRIRRQPVRPAPVRFAARRHSPAARAAPPAISKSAPAPPPKKVAAKKAAAKKAPATRRRRKEGCRRPRRQRCNEALTLRVRARAPD